MSCKFLQRAGSLLFVIAFIAIIAFSNFGMLHSAYAASSVTVNGATTFQTIDGFGFSEAFGQASTLESASSSAQQQILNDLFSTSTGAGFTILRNIIPSDSSHTIEPNASASPSATPTYTWDGNNWGQVALSKQAMSYGVSQIYADAWSAPGFMKTNGSESNGSTLCGAPGASACSTGDWRQAYANYLVQYIKDYASSGVTVSHVGFVNEPSFAASYSSMIMSGAQSADFIKVLGPTLKSAGLSTKIVCCDSEGWNLASGDVGAITSDSTALSYVSNFSSHGYTAAPTSTINTAGKNIWETEWSTFDTLNNAWDDGSDASGFTWAQHIYSGLTSANLSAFLYWWGMVGSSTTDNEGLLQLTSSGTVTTSGRLWALANYSRFIRPGAVRIGVTSGDSNLQASAYKNTNGSVSIVVLNTSSSSIPASYALQGTGITDGAVVTPYLTNGSNNTAAQATTSVSGGSFSATIPARSLVTYSIPASSSITPTPTSTLTTTPMPTAGTTPTPTPTPTSGSTCKAVYTITNQWTGGFGASIAITNTGTTAINGWTLTFIFPNGQTITQLWNGRYTQSGANVTITNLSYNGTIPAGQTFGSSPGFNGSWNGSNTPPTAITLNGTTCSSS
jgi:O-glycosyl hydrolase